MSTVKLLSSDGIEHEVEKDIAIMSVTVKESLEDIGDMDAPVPLPNVSGRILLKVLEYCTYHYENPTPESEENKFENHIGNIIPWDKEFCKEDQATLFELILAANYLNIKPLLDLTCKTVAGMIKGKTAEEIRKTFNIKNDFTPEEEMQILKESDWCEEEEDNTQC